ncbi:MAG: hypothetical protein IJ731_00130, partial [Eubacterium sp.]|nr:hypothetical protein [Eubacterium sp.]
MRKLTKRTLAVFLSVIMAFPTILAMPFAAEAATKWTAVASSDFSAIGNAVDNGSLGEVPTYNNQGNPISWSTTVWTGNGNAQKESDALYIPDGYLYMSGYNANGNSGIPIKNAERFKIDFAFRYKDATIDGTHATDNITSDGTYTFMKIGAYGDVLSNYNKGMFGYSTFTQDANGKSFSYDTTISDGGSSKRVATSGDNIQAGVNYHYIIEYTGSYARAYVTDDSKNVIQEEFYTTDSNVLGEFAKGLPNANYMKIGDSNNSYYLRALEYRYITFYTGEEGEEEPEDDPASSLADTAEGRILQAIAKYETAMNGGIKTKMTAAYDAYVAANKAYDAYKYGNLDIDLDEYATALRLKVNAMKEWSYNPTFATPYFPDDSGDNSAYANNGVSNILYWETPVKTSNTTANVEMELWYPNNSVLLLDGKNSASMPVMAMAKKTSYNKSRYVYELYPSKSSSDNADNEYFKLEANSGNTAWYAHNGTTHRSKDWIWSMTASDNLNRVKGEAGDYSDSAKILMQNSGTTSYWASFANVLKFYGSQEEYAKTYSLDWYALTGDSASDSRFMSPTGQISVVNYKPLIDLMESSAKQSPLSVAENTYTQGGLRDLLAAYDIATSVDPTAYDYSNLSVLSTVASDIEEAYNALNAASATQDTSSYTALRRAMDAKKSIYEDGSEGYKADSWAEFVSVYEEAVRVFSVIQTTGYNSETDETATSEYAQLLADSLNAIELVTDIDKVDSTQLELAIGEADDAIANMVMFTNDSFTASNIETVIANAKIAVWGAEANYPNAKFKLDLSDANTAIAETQLENVRNAVYTLRINTATEVSTANGYSMDSAIAYAGEFNEEDYGNYADLASAVAAANSFVPTVNMLAKDCVLDKIAEYKSKTRAIINAINLLRPAFDKITNGTFGSFTANDSTRIDSTEGNSRWRLNFVRNNNIVVFRTQYEPFTVDIGGATLEWFTKESYDADLDSINVYDESTENGIGEIAKNGAGFWFADPSAASIGDPENYPGMLSASTEENSTYTLKNLTVSWSSAERLGRDMDGNDITDTSYAVDEILSSTQGTSTSARTGTVTTHNGTTYINADYTVFIPRESKRVLSAETLPMMTEHTLSSNFGMVYAWKYAPSGIKWVGYSHNRTPYTQTTYVMNIAPLMELIEQCKAIQADEQQYKLDSWNAFSTALSAARANMNYGDMTATAIEAECQTRYTNLWNAYKALEKAATNASIHTAVEADEAVGNTYKADNKDARWSASRWATFKAAYEAAASAIANGGTYSDVNVRNYGPEQQSAIDAVATALTTAYNELVQYGGRADFTALYNAAGQVGVEGLASDVYTTTSLKAVSTALANATQFPYLNMTETEKNAVYSEPENVQAIADEVEAINSLYATEPIEAAVDGAALAAAKATAKASIKDP